MAMRFSRIELQSWKNFKKADVPLADRVFAIGANASGKSNFLEVFRFLHDLVVEGGGLAKAVSLREGMTKLRSLHTTGKSTIEVRATMNDGEREWVYTLAFDADPKRGSDPVIVREHVQRDGATVLSRPDAEDRNDPQRLHQTALQQLSFNKPFRVVAEFFRSIRYVNLLPQLIREGQRSSHDSPGEDPHGRDFLERVRQTPKGDRTRRLKAIESLLRSVVPSFTKLRHEEDERGRPHLCVGFKHWRGRAAKQRESQFSDGTLRLIAILWALQEQEGPLLLEEPEWSLHAGVLDRLAPFIARMQRKVGGRQVIISTHSDRLLSDPGIRAEEVLLLLPDPKGGTRIEVGARRSAVKTAMEQGLSASEAALPLTRIDTMPLFGKSA